MGKRNRNKSKYPINEITWNHSVSMEVQKTINGNKVGKVVRFCKLFQPLDVIPGAERE
jgi:hypothetical protein